MNGESTKRVIAPWLLMIFIIVLLSGGGYLAWHYFGSKSGTTTATATPSVTTSSKKISPSPTVISTTDWQTFNGVSNYQKIKYSFKCPSNYTIQEDSQKGSIYVINNDSNKMFMRFDLRPAGLEDPSVTVKSEKKTFGNNIANIDNIFVNDKLSFKIIDFDGKLNFALYIFDDDSENIAARIFESLTFQTN